MAALPSKQRGAALVVGLLIMLALTLIGVTTVGLNSMELRMASNMQNESNAFQAANAGIDVGIMATNTGNITTLQNIAAPTLSGATVGITAQFTRFTSGISCPNTSPERARCANFEVTAVGQHVGSNARSTQTQGFYVIVPQIN